MKITINYQDDAKGDRVVEAFCSKLEYGQNKLQGESKLEFVERRLKERLMAESKDYRREVEIAKIDIEE